LIRQEGSDVKPIDVFEVAAPLTVALTFATVAVWIAIWAADRFDRYR
jgi:hypothetical protein